MTAAITFSPSLIKCIILIVIVVIKINLKLKICFLRYISVDVKRRS